MDVVSVRWLRSAESVARGREAFIKLYFIKKLGEANENNGLQSGRITTGFAFSFFSRV